ncbi:MAG TPA: hypothetical protein VKU37_10275 [Verrucomicrobiae bacterium]|nr:hypothetical protein [Verrucomicrobiae bacterium]
MTPYTPTSCAGSTPRFHTAPTHYLALALCSMLLLTGCSTTLTYQPNLPAGPARPAGYPIPVYTEDMTIPRPCEVIGTVFVGGGHFTMRGGSAEEETARIIKTAWEKGADAVQVKSVEDPGYSSASYRMMASLLRYTDVWETFAVSESGFAHYLDTHRQNLDPIEGIWDGTGTVPHRIGIVRDHSRPGRDFVGFILGTADPTWHEGYKKIDIQRGVQPGSYVLDYYLDNFSRKEITVILGQNQRFTLNMPTSDEDADIITYSKSR